MLSAQNKQASTAALEKSRPHSSHRRTVSESSGGVGGRGIKGSGSGGGVSAGKKHAAHSLMTLAQLQYKRVAVSKVSAGSTMVGRVKYGWRGGERKWLIWGEKGRYGILFLFVWNLYRKCLCEVGFKVSRSCLLVVFMRA